MRQAVRTLFCAALVFGTPLSANALLIDRGGGLIYDSTQNLTWLQDANLAATNTFGVQNINANGSMNWYTAIEWIAAMNAVNYLGYSDWRLTDASYLACQAWQGFLVNCTQTEFGSLYDEGLGNKPIVDSSGNIQADWGLQQTGPFINLQPVSYWTATTWPQDSSAAMRFDFNYGGLDETQKDYFSFPFAWAVRDGDVSVAVPEPNTLALFGLGLAGIGFARRRMLGRVAP